MSSSDNPVHASRLHPTHIGLTRAQKGIQPLPTNLQQIQSTAKMAALTDESTFNPLAIARRFERLESKSSKKGEKEEETGKTQKDSDKKIKQVERISKIADEYSRKNQELQSRTLVFVRERITKNDTPQEVIRKVLETYPDYALADEVLDFLMETSEPAVIEVVRQAKKELNRDFGREIRAGRNISEKARDFAQQGLGSPTALREIYRDITSNPRDPNTLFEQLSSSFPYEKMKTLIEFMLHALGSDLKAKGPSIPRGELHRLVSETRVLQAILGVYRFFKSRMPLINGSFTRHGLVLPTRITFELLAKIYMRYLQERYPSSDKVRQLSIQLGIAEELDAQLIIFLQLRDASRQTAPRLFRSDQQRHDTLRSFMDALKQIDDELEEEAQEEVVDEKGRKLKRLKKKPPQKLS